MGRSLVLARLTRSDALRELLHDADEGMLSFDPISSPLKPSLGADYDSLVARLRSAIETRYAIPAWDEKSYAAHKRADRLAAASEAVHVAGWSNGDLHDTLGIQIRPLNDDPLPQIPGLKPWEPWPARMAAALFLAKAAALEPLADSLADQVRRHDNFSKIKVGHQPCTASLNRVFTSQLLRAAGPSRRRSGRRPAQALG